MTPSPTLTAPPPESPTDASCSHDWRVLARWATKVHCVCVRCHRHRLFVRS